MGNADPELALGGRKRIFLRTTVSVVGITSHTTADVWPDANGHGVTIVEKGRSGLARWKCSCGATMGGQWCSSPEEAAKRASRHLEDAIT